MKTSWMHNAVMQLRTKDLVAVKIKEHAWNHPLLGSIGFGNWLHVGVEGQVVKDDFALILSDRVDGEKRNEESWRRRFEGSWLF